MSYQNAFTDDDDQVIADEMAGHGTFASFIDSIMQDDGTLRFQSTLSRALLSPTQNIYKHFETLEFYRNIACNQSINITVRREARIYLLIRCASTLLCHEPYYRSHRIFIKISKLQNFIETQLVTSQLTSPFDEEHEYTC